MKSLLILTLMTSLAQAGTNITSSTAGLAFATDGLSKETVQAMLDAQTTKIIAAMPKCEAVPPTTPGPTPTPTSPPVAAGSIFIGSTEYKTLAEAGAAYKPGETISIKKNLVDQSTALVNGDVTVECAPGVKVDWTKGRTVRLAWGKAIFNVEGKTKNFKIINCEVSGAAVADANGAAVRLIDNGTVGLDSATFENVNFHDNENGILGAAKKTVIKNSKFWHNGKDGSGQTHNVYFSGWGDEVLVTGSTFGAVNTGNVFKSRAKKTIIDRSVFGGEADATWNGSWVIDIPNGGDVKITNSVMHKSNFSAQGNFFSFGVEGVSAGRGNSYELSNNVIISDHNYSHFGVFKNSPVMTVTGNTFVGKINNAPAAGNKVFATRAEAGLPAAPALPAVPAL